MLDYSFSVNRISVQVVVMSADTCKEHRMSILLEHLKQYHTEVEAFLWQGQ
jgi:hypothetical protein